MKKKKTRGIAQGIALITQLGISVLAPIILCTMAGIFVDNRFDTNSLLILLLLGICAGARNGYLLAMKSIHNDNKEKNDKRD